MVTHHLFIQSTELIFYTCGEHIFISYLDNGPFSTIRSSTSTYGFHYNRPFSVNGRPLKRLLHKLSLFLMTLQIQVYDILFGGKC